MLFEVRLELERSLAVVTWLSARFRAMGRLDDKLLLCRTEDFLENVSVMSKDFLIEGDQGNVPLWADVTSQRWSPTKVTFDPRRRYQSDNFCHRTATDQKPLLWPTTDALGNEPRSGVLPGTIQTPDHPARRSKHIFRPVTNRCTWIHHSNLYKRR